MSKFAEVVNLAVEHHGDSARLVKCGLAPAGQVDHREAAAAQSQPRLYENRVVIRPAMRLRQIHAAQQVAVWNAPAGRVERSSNPAHDRRSPPGWPPRRLEG